jgi:DNA-binding transcriptional MerR regulator
LIVVEERRLLTTSEAAKLIGVHPRTLSRYASEGRVFPTMILPSGHYRWELDDLRRQLRDGRRPDPPKSDQDDD